MIAGSHIRYGASSCVDCRADCVRVPVLVTTWPTRPPLHPIDNGGRNSSVCQPAGWGCGCRLPTVAAKNGALIAVIQRSLPQSWNREICLPRPRVGTTLGPSWGVAPSWGELGASWGGFGPNWGCPVPSSWYQRGPKLGVIPPSSTHPQIGGFLVPVWL